MSDTTDNLPQYHTTFDRAQKLWVTQLVGVESPVFTAKTKGEILKINAHIGPGSFRVHLKNGKIQDERTFPRSRDPKSKG